MQQVFRGMAEEAAFAAAWRELGMRRLLLVCGSSFDSLIIRGRLENIATDAGSGWVRFSERAAMVKLSYSATLRNVYSLGSIMTYPFRP